ncbi:MAG: 2-C-methyl-D-erythritol 4-phosphate cytidylyltransferase [Desulfuromonadales bacterium]|jgi:2-C-methyl-D-erythritol 4-phosphate cytidylyltransferase
MNVHVLVPAAGSGRRLAGGIRKQYLELGDRPVLVQTLVRLAAQPLVTAVHLVVPEEDVAFCRRELVERYRIDKIGAIIAGGRERQDSVRNGLEACGAAGQDVILVHDAVRPFFPAEQIGPLVQLAAVEGAALLAVPAQDTIKEVFDGRVRSTLDRSLLWQVQTPQAFRCDRIREAHRRAQMRDHVGTDDASLIEWCGWPVAVLEGHPHNIKITTPADLALARALLDLGEVSLT